MSMPDESMVAGEFSAEMQSELARLGSLVTEFVDFSRTPDDASRALDERINVSVWNVDLPAVAGARHVRIPAHGTITAAPCDAVIYEPVQRTGDGVIFFVHGGGWSYCSLKTHERFMRVLCNESGKTLVGVHYRLAPEHPFPAGLSDVISALRTVMDDPRSLGLPAGPVVIGGDSAGGNLALAALLHEIDAGRELPAGALLFYGVMGRDFETPSYNAYADGYVLTKAVMQQLWSWYDPTGAASNNPLAVPLLASDSQLRALPPLFLLAAELDPLTSDTLNLKARLTQVGRDDPLLIEPGVIHGYLQMTSTVEAARRSTRAAAQAANRFMSTARV